MRFFSYDNLSQRHSFTGATKAYSTTLPFKLAWTLGCLSTSCNDLKPQSDCKAMLNFANLFMELKVNKNGGLGSHSGINNEKLQWHGLNPQSLP